MNFTFSQQGNFFPCLQSCTAFNLDFYTEVMDLTYLLDHLAADPFFKKFRLLNEKLAEVIQDYSLVSFVPLNVQVSLKVSILITYRSSFVVAGVIYIFHLVGSLHG